MYDIAIVGAGPSGATLARMLAPAYRVLLVDRRRLDLEPGAAGLHKVCGGLLAPAAQHELARQGLGVPSHVTRGPQLFAVRTLDLAAELERLYQRFYVNVDREAFDRWLLSLVSDSVDTAFGWSLRELERDADASFLRFDTPAGGSAGVRARLVVGADGASSAVRRLAFPRTPAPARYVAVQAECEQHAGDPYYGAVFDARITDFYGWTIPKGDRVLVGIALPAGDGTVGRFDRFLEAVRANGFGVGSEVGRSSAAIARPSNPWHLCPGAGGVLLAGEAAGFISPSSAEGISYALKSAAILADALHSGLAGADARYREVAWPLACKVGLKAAKASAIYGAATRRLIMRSGLGSISGDSRVSPLPEAGLAR